MTAEKDEQGIGPGQMMKMADSLEAEMVAEQAKQREQRVRDNDVRRELYGDEAERLALMRDRSVGPDSGEILERSAETVKTMTRRSRAWALLLAALIAGFTQHPLAFPAGLVVYLLSRLVDVVAMGDPGYRQQLYSSVISQELALRNILVEVRKLAGAPEDDRRP
jgi:hypothetical protein